MSREFAAIAAIIAAVTSSPAVAQDEVQRLEPESAWYADYAEHSCGLRRLFGGEGKRVYLELRQYTPRGGIIGTIASGDFRRRSNLRNLQITFQPDTAPLERVQPIQVSADDIGEGILFNAWFADQQQRARFLETQANDHQAVMDQDILQSRETAIDSVRVDGLYIRDIELRTGSLGPPMQVMRDCLDNLQSYWGFDPAVQNSLSRPVRSFEMHEWSRALMRQYPRNLLNSGQQAYVRARVNVSADGTPTDCLAQTDFNNEAFNKLACDLLLEHGRFEPALDAAGEPVDSYWATAVRYQIQ